MASVVDIYNLALMRIGDSSTVATTDEASNEARACTVFYEQCRDTMLREYPWRFARRRAQLAQNTDTAPTNWGYVYAYPTDCHRALFLTVPGTRQPIINQQFPWEVASDGTSRVIYTDISSAELVYTAKVTDTTQFDPLFVSALAYYLAAEICMPLAINANIQNAARQAYMQIVASAMAADLNEGFLGGEPDGEFLQIRNLGIQYPGASVPWQAFPGAP